MATLHTMPAPTSDATLSAAHFERIINMLHDHCGIRMRAGKEGLVKARLAKDPTVSAAAINVETLNGTVMLSGFAKSAAERSTAESLTRNVKGVRAVRNELEAGRLVMLQCAPG